MFTLVKQHFTMHSIFSYLLIVLFLTFFYIGGIPPYFLFFVILLSFVIAIYYEEDKYSTQRFFVSLPIAKKRIIQSRYISTVILGLTLMIFQQILMGIVKLRGTSNNHYIYGWKDWIILISMTLIVASIMLFIYSTIRAFMVATGFLIIGLFITILFLLITIADLVSVGDVIQLNDLDPGFQLFVEQYLPFQPYISLFIISIVLFFLSMKGSELIFLRKDLS